MNLHLNKAMKKQLSIFFCIATCLAIGISCGKDDDDNGIIFNGVKPGAYESRLEVPRLQSSGTVFIHHSTKVGADSVMTYCLEYNLSKNHSRWVAFRFDGKTRGIGSGRSDAWADDPKLDSYYHVGAGYFNGGNRGHICASYDRQYSKEANRQTFYMTNMSPMNGSFNSNYWTAFEQYVQEKGRSANFADTLYVVKGGTIANGMTQGTAVSSFGKSIVIPKYYFIALLRFKGGSYSSVGFWVEHNNHGYKNSSAPRSVIGDCVVNIDRLEQLTGIDFFHNLPDGIEQSIESEDIETLRNLWDI